MPLKSGWSRKNYFNTAWQDANAKVAETSHNCKIKIINTDLEEGVFDPRTGETTYPPNSTAVIYEGGARAQPRGSSLDRSNQAADTNVRRMQFQIPINKAGDIRPNMHVEVTEAELYPMMTKFDYRVQGVVNSGNPIEVTFVAMVDEEVVSGN